MPKRLIGEATQLLKLIQAYLEETDEEGLILALDWEKAFDRVSWDYYHQATSHRSPRLRQNGSHTRIRACVSLTAILPYRG